MLVGLGNDCSVGKVVPKCRAGPDHPTLREEGAPSSVSVRAGHTGGGKGVEMDAIFLAPTPIDKTNTNVVIEAGHIAKAKVCEGAMAGVNGC